MHLSCHAVAPADVHLQQRPRHAVEAGGEYDDVERILGTALRSDSLRGDALDRICADIDQVDVVAVEGLEIVGVDRRSLGRVGMVDVG